MHQPTTRTVRSGPAESGRADLTVVGGAGHVGIPLVLAFAEAGMTVNVAAADLKGKPVVDVWGFLKNANVVR